MFVGGEPALTAGFLTALRATAEAEGGSLVLLEGHAALGGAFETWGSARTDFAVMRALKAKFDPGGVLNPGRFVGGL